MNKLFLSALIILGTLMSGTHSQAQTVADQASPPPGDHLLNAPYLTPTGETVAHPGESQSGGPTKLDQRIERQDDAIDKSICSNCGQ
ncbi:hypothetical protein [Beijerinckia indica]|uniref:Uncharacterized protein n=1 Tax=Beijerinckia indica subsp. indica (strain ATCC 9039 / DSM 1715 / NCIMB 8712) TaxID=395963 RepID=B2IH26_BEII9|nr:hypothetical protein [Beijerinckia indica]ACB94440.1 hypothetical protein Bind_0790 [Beijerinckia indica subsp. indica ATCC 9039]